MPLLSSEELFVIEKMQDPEFVRGQSSSWQDLSLARGYASLVLLYSAVAKKFPQKNHDVTLASYVKRLLVTLKSGPIGDLSLFDGLCGACFALLQASEVEKKYRAYFEMVHSLLIEKVDHVSGWDLTHGASGIGLYLAYEKSASSQQALKRLLATLVDSCKVKRVQEKLVPGWYQSQDEQFTDEDKTNYPQGNFNLGLAHGAPGILLTLSQALKMGIEVTGQRSCMHFLIDWIQAKAFTQDRFLIWPERIPFEERNERGLIRMAWCYGNPGVLRSLYIAALSLQDKTLLQFCKARFTEIFELDEEIWYLSSSTLCHGKAGLLLLTQHMAKDTGDHRLQQKCEMLTSKIRASFDQTAPFGFDNLEPKKCPREMRATGFQRHCNAGFIDGAAGILLALLNQHHVRDTHEQLQPLLIA